MGNWHIERDGFKAEWVERDGGRVPIVRCTGPGLTQPMEWPTNGDDAITQLNVAIDTAKRYKPGRLIGCGDDRTYGEAIEPETRVVFRKWSDGQVIAFFPGDETYRLSHGTACGSYMHIGQHGEADTALMDRLKPATPEEYASLKAELEGEPFGYRFTVEP